MQTPTTKKKCTLCFSGGASHGADEWGAWLALSSRVDPIAVSGASIGAVIAAAIACGLDNLKVTNQVMRVFSENLLFGGKQPFSFSPRILWSRGGGVHDWTHCKAVLKEIFGELRMRDTKIPLFIAVTDSYTRRPLYVSSKDHPNALIYEVLTASSAVHPLIDAQEIPSLGLGNRLFVDGGWSDNLPYRPLCDFDAPSIHVYLAGSDVDNDNKPDIIPATGLFGLLAADLEAALFVDPDFPDSDEDILIPIFIKGSGFDFALSKEEIRTRLNNGATAARKVIVRGVL